MLLPVRAVCKKQDVDAPQMVIVVHDPGSANTRKLGSAGAGRGKVLVAEFARIQPVNPSELLRIQHVPEEIATHKWVSSDATHAGLSTHL